MATVKQEREEYASPSSRDSDLSSQLLSKVQIDEDSGYFVNIGNIRSKEYASLADSTYLDHAGTTLYAKSLIERWTADLTSNLFGNPHSGSASSQLTTRRVDDTRLKVLKLFNASPEHYEVIFVSNATAGAKLVAEALRDHEGGFRYAHHAESHTSLVGVRELAAHASLCFKNPEECFASVSIQPATSHNLYLISYPGQSNMSGDRLPVDWCSQLRKAGLDHGYQAYVLFDAASLVSTAPLDLSNPKESPDFTIMSFYKIFGFPDLGALIVRKDSSDVLLQRKYFAGGTVEMVTTEGQIWHAKKAALHSMLEEGTLAFHNVLALDHAIDIHMGLYGSMNNISRHTTFLAAQTRQSLQHFRHANGRPVCQLYNSSGRYEAGPIVAFNLQDSRGQWISASEVEKLSIVKGIQFRVGGLCNPGGISTHLGLTSGDIQRNYAAGYRCGGDNDIMDGKPTGVIRISFGAMSSRADLDKFLDFIKEFYVEQTVLQPVQPSLMITAFSKPKFYIEQLSVFPIKSCAAFKIEPNQRWKVSSKGLAWDREWCLVHAGTNVALNQKRFPRMALLQPQIDLDRCQLIVRYKSGTEAERKIEISLVEPTQNLLSPILREKFNHRRSNVCGQDIAVQIYTSSDITNFFSEILDVPCYLARYHKDEMSRSSSFHKPQMGRKDMGISRGSVMLSNESPILLISRSSVNKLNEDIKLRNSSALAASIDSDSRTQATRGKTVPADSFRGNIVIAEYHHQFSSCQATPESPYVEDAWSSVRVNGLCFDVLGPCQRCQMVCVDQSNAQRQQEPFSTLAKTRRKDGRVWFGMHMGLSSTLENDSDDGRLAARYVQVGDQVEYELTAD